MKQKVHEKTTYTSRVNARTKVMIRPAGDTDDDLTDDDEKDNDGTMVLKDDPEFVLSTTKGCCLCMNTSCIVFITSSTTKCFYCILQSCSSFHQN